MPTTILKTLPDLIPNKKNSAARSGLFTVPVVAFLSVLMLGVVALSMLVLQKQSLRLDESQSIWQSSHTPAGVIVVISHDVHVPLYGLLLHFWMYFFGTGAAAVRSLSLIFFIATIPAVYLLVRVVYSKSIGLFVALLVALSPFLNWYGNETRMYSLLTLVTVLNQYFFLRIFTYNKNPRGNLINLWWGYAAVSLVGIYTHYFFWLVLLAEAVFYFSYHSSFPKHSLRNLTLIAFALAGALAPWLWFVREQNMVGNSAPALLKPSTVDIFNTFSQFLFGFQDDHINTIIVSLWPISVLLGFLSMRKKNRISPEAVFFLISAILPIVAAFAISVIYTPVFLSRYLILAAPALYIFLAWFFSTYPPQIANALKIVLIGVMILTLYQQTASAATPVKENYETASAYIQSHAGPSDIVILSAPFTIYPFEYYYKGDASITTIPDWNPYTTGPIPPFSQAALAGEVAALEQNHARAWVLLSYDQGYQTDVYQYFESHFQRLDHKQFSAGINLYEYQLRYY